MQTFTNHPYYLTPATEKALNAHTDATIRDAVELYRQGRWCRLTAAQSMRNAGAFEAEITEALDAVETVQAAA